MQAERVPPAISGAVVSFKWDEVLKSGFATNVLMSSTSMLVSTKAMEKLSPAARRMVSVLIGNESMPQARTMRLTDAATAAGIYGDELRRVKLEIAGKFGVRHQLFV